MEQYYKIAGLIVKMDSFGRTVEQAKPYEWEGSAQPDVVIVSNFRNFQARYPGISDNDAEYLCSGASFYRQLLDADGMMLHASAVVVDGKAYLFTADSGTGKSTHTQLWLKKFGERAYILNDDKPALRLEHGVWYAYGTPWSGKHDISVDARIPVGGVAVVERGELNEIFPFTGVEVIRVILSQVNRPRAQEYRVKLMELLDKLITNVPVWKLRCNMEPEAADVSYGAMAEGRKQDWCNFI